MNERDTTVYNFITGNNTNDDLTAINKFLSSAKRDLEIANLIKDIGQAAWDKDTNLLEKLREQYVTMTQAHYSNKTHPIFV